jgi:hypothetical protein
MHCAPFRSKKDKDGRPLMSLSCSKEGEATFACNRTLASLLTHEAGGHHTDS